MYFSTYKDFPIPKNAEVASGMVMKIVGHGTVNVEMLIEGKSITHYLEDVWYVPEVWLNFIFSQFHSIRIASGSQVERNTV